MLKQCFKRIYIYIYFFYFFLDNMYLIFKCIFYYKHRFHIGFYVKIFGQNASVFCFTAVIYFLSLKMLKRNVKQSIHLYICFKYLFQCCSS